MNEWRLRIVVCDIDAQTLIDLEHMLEDAGFNTTTTWDAAELARLLEENLFHLLIIGDHPPQMDVEDVLKELCAQDRSELKVLCLVSARKLHKSVVERLQSAGAMAVVSRQDYASIVEQAELCLGLPEMRS